MSLGGILQLCLVVFCPKIINCVQWLLTTFYVKLVGIIIIKHPVKDSTGWCFHDVWGHKELCFDPFKLTNYVLGIKNDCSSRGVYDVYVSSLTRIAITMISLLCMTSCRADTR